MEITMRELRETERPSSSPASIWQIFEDCRAQTQLRFGIITEPEDSIFLEPVRSNVAQALSVVFGSVLRNINYHSSLSAFDGEGRPVPRVLFTTTELQGEGQAVIVLENYSKKFLGEQACKELYRYPVQGGRGNLRLGTYIAGLNARRIGARIHACALEDNRTFRTTLVIPAGEPL